ncbi:MAG: hypothetical protein WD046_00945 [Paracoccaceae bacterium]
MNLNAPNKMMFLISLVMVALAVISAFIVIPVVSAYAFWIAVGGYAVLAFASLFNGE